MEILDRYIDQLLEKSTPQAPIWNLEKIRAGKKAFLELYGRLYDQGYS